MKRPKISNSFKTNTVVFNSLLKDVKKSLPKECTFLSLIKTKEGFKLSAVINKEEYRYSLPYDLKMTSADWERIVSLIKERCYE